MRAICDLTQFFISTVITNVMCDLAQFIISTVITATTSENFGKIVYEGHFFYFGMVAVVVLDDDNKLFHFFKSCVYWNNILAVIKRWP